MIGTHKFSCRVGLFTSFEKEKGIQVLAIPIELNYLMGYKHHLEFGTGFTYYQFLDDDATDVYLALRTGYRYQNIGGGLFFRFGLGISIPNLFYKHDEFFVAYPIIGVALGYTLKRKKL
jgi:hypothetical protein